MCIQEQLNQTELHFWVLADSLLLIYKATGWQQRNSWCANTVQMVLWKKNGAKCFGSSPISCELGMFTV